VCNGRIILRNKVVQRGSRLIDQVGMLEGRIAPTKALAGSLFRAEPPYRAPQCVGTALAVGVVKSGYTY
jgi:hypothetical protein